MHLDALLAETHLAVALDDVVDLFLLLVVPRHLAAMRFEGHVAHRKVRALDGAHAPDQVLCAPARRVRPPGDLRQIGNGHDIPQYGANWPDIGHTRAPSTG